MRNLYFYPAAAALLLGAATACSDSGAPDPVPPHPTVEVEITSLDRTCVAFTLSTDNAADWAYVIRETGEEAPATAEELFAEADESGMFEAAKTVALESRRIEGGKTYRLYAAVRQINPFVYAPIETADLDTNLAYEETITLDAVSIDGFTYHIKPAGGGKFKHLAVFKSDFEWLKAYLGINDRMYVDTFGFLEEGEKSFSYKDKYDYGSGYTQHIVSDADFIIFYGPVDPATGKVTDETQRLEFSTLPAGEATQNIVVGDLTKTSMSVRFTVTPEEGIERYRVYVSDKAAFGQLRIEGEYMVRAALIGDPTDKSKEYYEPAPFDFDGLSPDTEYTIGVIGFDAQNREKMVFTDFSTTPPTGPVPVIRFEEQAVDEPWQQVKVKATLEHAVSAKWLLDTSADFEQATTGAGVAVAEYLFNRGTELTEAELASALDKGILFENNSLTPATEYRYGIVAINEEGVAVAEVYAFTTAEAPVSSLREQLPGRYRATCKDMDGVEYDFTVEISAGENEALKTEYAQKGLLAILGFEPCGVPYASPQTLLDNGWAADEATANANYGPKILLQINADNTINTVLANDLANTFVSGVFNNLYLQIKGYARQSSGRIYGVLCPSFPVTVSEDRTTLTFGKYTDKDDFWLGMYDGEQVWYGGTDRFRGDGPLTLTRIADEPAPQAHPVSRPAPRLIERSVGQVDPLTRRSRMTASLQRQTR